jgi:hypothetical protein
VSKTANKVIHSKDRDIISTVIVRCDEDKQRIRTPNNINALGTGITLSGHADVSQAAAGPCRLQLCAVLGSSDMHVYQSPGYEWRCKGNTKRGKPNRRGYQEQIKRSGLSWR